MKQNEKINYLTEILVGMGEQFPQEIIDDEGTLWLIDGGITIDELEEMFGVESVFDIDKDDLESYLQDNIPNEADI